jgi:16S rRNA (guanine527-N7)-methyltransferase
VSTARIASLGRDLGVALAPESVAALARYVELVFRWQRIANLTGAAGPDTFIDEHLSDCLSVLPFLGEGALADIGSGSGLPGLVVAILRPDIHVALVEPRGKRARFLQQVRIELKLTNVNVHTARVEAWSPARPIDTLICRAFSSLPDFIVATRHLQRPGLRLLAMKGELPKSELAEVEAQGFAVQSQLLTVPGWSRRHLVIIQCH